IENGQGPRNSAHGAGRTCDPPGRMPEVPNVVGQDAQGRHPESRSSLLREPRQPAKPRGGGGGRSVSAKSGTTGPGSGVTDRKEAGRSGPPRRRGRCYAAVFHE